MGAEVVVPSSDLAADIALLEDQGFRLDVIFPADEPRVAQMTGHGVSLRLDTSSSVAAPTLRLVNLDESVTTSAGAHLVGTDAPDSVADHTNELILTSGGKWGDGRAGMQYRDLIPDRRGGQVIASHIRIAEAGPVPDYVHHHDIRFQMIYCRTGRVEVIYEDQGESFWMEEGDCVLQPPHIRHRVLASSEGLEVVEIASPAEHPTYIEHDITLPTTTIDSTRNFGGQRFSFDRAADTEWTSFDEGWQQRSTGIESATAGAASVQVLRPMSGETATLTGSHRGDLFLLYVLSGAAELEVGGVTHELSDDDSVAIPRNSPWSLVAKSADFTTLNVTLTAQGE